jgi:glycine cleavage system transcriptional repressor
MAKDYFSVLAIGRDTPGIVAAITSVLSEKHSCNIETSQMTILGGNFAISLIASTEEPLRQDELEGDLAKPESYSQVRHVYVSPIEQKDFRSSGGPVESHIVSIEDSDRPGLLSELARVLADNSVNITGLASGCPEEGVPLCTIGANLVLPENMEEAQLRDALTRAFGDDVAWKLERIGRRPA